MQWMALVLPDTMQMIERQVEGVILPYRPPPAETGRTELAGIFNLNSQMEYRTFDVRDPAVLLASPEGRLGRKIHDILPSDLMDRFDRCLSRARKALRPATYTYPVNGVNYKATIVVPTRDTILVSLAKVLGLVAACEVLCPYLSPLV